MSEKLFSPANREKVLRAVVGKPSGVIAEVGGLSFNLVALSAGEVLSVLGLLTKFADLATQSEKGTLSGPAVMRAIGEDGGTVAGLVKSVLKRSAGVKEPAELDLFETWFENLPIIESAQGLIPKILEANGLGSMMEARPPVPVEELAPAV